MYVDGDPKTSSTIIVGIVGVILLLAIVLFAVVLFQSVQNIEDQEKIYATHSQALADAQFQQLARITESRWVDEPAGILAIPIEDAIPLYVAKMKSQPAPTTMPVPGTATAKTPPGENP